MEIFIVHSHNFDSFCVEIVAFDFVVFEMREDTKVKCVANM